MAIHIKEFGGREVLMGAPSDVPFVTFVAPFAVLVTVTNQEELDEILSLAGGLFELGCKEFCCVGPKAESLHDQLDLLIEEASLIDVVTTWHEDAVEGCEYFLFGAGGQSLILYALVCRHLELLDALVLAAQAD